MRAGVNGSMSANVTFLAWCVLFRRQMLVCVCVILSAHIRPSVCKKEGDVLLEHLKVCFS